MSTPRVIIAGVDGCKEGQGPLPVKVYANRIVTPQNYMVTETITSGGSKLFTIIPTNGYIARLNLLHLSILRPTSSTSGTHKVEIYHTLPTADVYAIISAEFGIGITCRANEIIYGTLVYPTTADRFERNISNIWFTKTKPLLIKYTNSTDVSQTGTIGLRTVLVEEAIDYEPV